jgi:hypothetical protein
VEVLPGLSLTAQLTVHESAEDKRVRELMKAATALSKTDPNAAVDTFREAAALVSQTVTDYSVDVFLRVPRYLQMAGRQGEAWAEFQRLLQDGYPNMQQGKAARHGMEAAVYDKMRLFLQREKRPAEAVRYGLRSIIADVRAWMVPTPARRDRLESESTRVREQEQDRLRSAESHRMQRLQYAQAEEALDSQLVKLLKPARLESCHDEALALLREWLSRLPDADDTEHEERLDKVLAGVSSRE